MTALLQLPLVNVISNQLQSIVTLIDCSQSVFFFRKIVEIERSPSPAAISLSRNKKKIGNRPVEQAKKMKFIKD